jgi:catechol 2,3-dioxygenase-like lactoylglutathione lyase family enzyme
MFSHVTLGTADLPRALAFYAPVLALLGLEQRFVDLSVPWAGWQSPGAARPLFLITAPADGAAASVGNGVMVALSAPSHAAVDAAHALALSLGGADEGAPGLRPQYHAAYYGAYVRDPDGNKLCFVCHHAETGPVQPPR